MEEIKIIEEKEVLGKDFKIYGDYENPLFLAKDVAEWIEYDISNVSKLVNMVDESEKTTRKIITNGSNYQTEAWFLTEDGLYEVLMQSRKPIAKSFKKEVKKILKDIRKHGVYLTNEKIEEALINPDTIIKIATQLKEEREIRNKLELENTQKDQIIGELKPKADYTDSILQSKSLVTITQIAKDYGMSGAELNKILHDLKIQYKQSNQWLLYRDYHDSGYTSSETIEITRSNGTKDTKMSTKWTQKGRLFLYEKLKKENIYPLIERRELFVVS